MMHSSHLVDILQLLMPVHYNDLPAPSFSNIHCMFCASILVNPPQGSISAPEEISLHILHIQVGLSIPL